MVRSPSERRRPDPRRIRFAQRRRGTEVPGGVERKGNVSPDCEGVRPISRTSGAMVSASASHSDIQPGAALDAAE